jgi:hypothetical protein
MKIQVSLNNGTISVGNDGAVLNRKIQNQYESLRVWLLIRLLCPVIIGAEDEDGTSINRMMVREVDPESYSKRGGRREIYKTN